MDGKITVSWLTPARYAGVTEDVARSRLKCRESNISVGAVVSITYKSGLHKARIINLNGRSEFLKGEERITPPLLCISVVQFGLVYSLRKSFLTDLS